METVKQLKERLQKNEAELNEHYKKCPLCNTQYKSEEEEIECFGKSFIIDEHYCIEAQIQDAEKTFQQELKDRKIKLPK